MVAVVPQHDRVAFPMERQPVAAIESGFENVWRALDPTRAQTWMVRISAELHNCSVHDGPHFAGLLAIGAPEARGRLDWRERQGLAVVVVLGLMEPIEDVLRIV